MSIDDLSPEDLDTLALAMDFFLCNYGHPDKDTSDIEKLFMLLDELALEANDSPVLSREDNLIRVDFTPKNG